MVSRRIRRDELLAELDEAGRQHSNATIMFHAVVSERMGLSTVEEKAIDLLDRHGPLTAGQLGQHTGLAPASVTGLIDRLVRKGCVRRVPHAEDRRRIIVEINPGYVERFAPLFAGMATRMAELYRGYTDAELELILDFMGGTSRILTECATELAATG